MPVEVLTELLNRHPMEEALSGAPPGHKAMFERCENIRPFLTPRRWSVEDVTGLFRYSSFNQFLITYYFTRYLVRDAADLRRLIAGVMQNLKSQNVVYAEVTIALEGYLRQGISVEDMRACLEEGAKLNGVRVQWIVDLIRDLGRDGTLALLDKIFDLRCESIVGITLGGSEQLFPPAQFSEVYAKAREHGLRLTVHAGESAGPESVWGAIRELGVERIGHGVRAVEDESLVAYLAENKIPLEVCPTSNLRTGIYPSYEAHPVKALFEAGVPITINTDDPTFFGTTLAEEYAHVLAMGVSAEGIFEMIRNGFRYAFLPESDIERYIGELEKERKRLLSGS
jgi:adenosine deaminase